MDEPEFHLLDDYEFLNGFSSVKKSMVESFDVLIKESKQLALICQKLGDDFKLENILQNIAIIKQEL